MEVSLALLLTQCSNLEFVYNEKYNPDSKNIGRPSFFGIRVAPSVADLFV